MTLGLFLLGFFYFTALVGLILVIFTNFSNLRNRELQLVAKKGLFVRNIICGNWFYARLWLFMFLLVYGFIFMNRLSDWAGFNMSYKEVAPILYRNLLVALAIVGWGRISWSLARFSLKVWAPVIYDTYRPYYNGITRETIAKSEEAVAVLEPKL